MELRPVAVLAVALVAVGVAAGAPAPQTAATVETNLTAETTQLSNESTTTVQVVVDGATGGVGSTELSLSVADPSVARITAVTFVGNATVGETTVAENGSTATASGVGLAQSGSSVTVVEATVQARGAGTTTLNLSVDSVADTEGRPYEVATAADSLRLTVGGETAEGSDSGQLPVGIVVLALVVAAVVAIGVYRYRSG